MTIDGELRSIPSSATGAAAGGTVQLTATAGDLTISAGSLVEVTGGSGNTDHFQPGAELTLSAAGNVVIARSLPVRGANGGRITVTTSGAAHSVTATGMLATTALSTLGFDGGAVSISATGNVQVATQVHLTSSKT